MSDGVSQAESRRPTRLPCLLVMGILLLSLLHVLHFGNVLGWTRGTSLDYAGRLVRANMTPFAWCGYLMLLLGLLAVWDGRSWLWPRRNRFAVCWLWSVPAWCYFDWMNFYFMRDPVKGFRAWEYVNLPPRYEDRVLGYLVAFGAIAPGMFLTAEVLQRLGFWKLQRQNANLKTEQGRALATAVFLLGLLLAPIPILFGTPLSNLAIWVGTWALLDPINFYFGRPSIVGDWCHGRWGRTLALGAGGLICGFLWEFWNFWAYTKWVYHLPFLGGWENVRYFEMPVAGLIGFIAFGIETWTMWQTALLVLSPFVEGERETPADQEVKRFTCF